LIKGVWGHCAGDILKKGDEVTIKCRNLIVKDFISYRPTLRQILLGDKAKEMGWAGRGT
jgi:hypothetical protein